MKSKFLKFLFGTRKKKVFSCILFLFIFIAALLITILHSPPFKQYLIKKADNFLQEKYQLSLNVDHIQYSLSRLSLSLDDIQVETTAPGTSLMQHFSAKRLHINLSLFSLLFKKIHIQDFELLQPHLVINQASTKKQATKTVPKKALRLRIDKLDLDGGIVEYNNKQYAVQGSLTNITTQVQYLKKEQKHRGEIIVENGKIIYQDSQFPLEQLKAEFRFDDERIDLDGFDLKSDSLAFFIRGWVQSYQTTPRFKFQMETSLQARDFLLLLDPKTEYAGQLQMKASIQGDREEYVYNGSLDGQNLTWGDLGMAKFQADFQGSESALSVSHFSSNVLAGELNGKLNMALLPHKEYSFSLNWDGIDLSRLTDVFPQIPLAVASQSSGSLEVHGSTLAPFETDVKGHLIFKSNRLESGTKKDQTLLDGDIRFKGTESEIEILPSHLSLNKDDLTFSGKIDKSQNIEGQFSIKLNDLSATEKLFSAVQNKMKMSLAGGNETLELAGQALFSGSIAGSLKNPQATLNIEGKNLAYNQLSLETLKGEFYYARNEIDVRQFLIGFKEGKFEISGNADYDPFENKFGQKSNLLIKLDKLNVGRLLQELEVMPDVAGFISAEASLSGNLLNPEAIFKADLTQGRIENEEISLLQVQGNYKDKNLSVENFNLTKDQANLWGNFHLDLIRQGYSIDLTAERIDLTGFKSLPMQKNSIQGIINFNLEGEGTFEEPKFLFRLSGDSLGYMNAELGKVKLTAESDGKTIKSNLSIPDTTTILQAEVPLEKPQVIQGKLSITNLKMEKLLRQRSPQATPMFNSELTGNVSFSIPVENREELTVNLNIENAKLEYQDLWLQNRQPISLSMAKEKIDVHDFQLIGSNTEFSIDGTLPLKGKTDGRINLDGNINLRLLQPLMKDSTIEGLIHLKGQIAKNLNQPEFSAELELKDGALTHPNIPYRLHDFGFRIQLDGQEVKLENLKAGIDQGLLTAFGNISLASLPLDLPEGFISSEEKKTDVIELTFSGIDLGNITRLSQSNFSENFDGQLDGNIRFSGSLDDLEHALIEGELQRLQFSFPPLAMQNEKTIQFNLKNNVVTLQNARIQGDRISIFLGGKIILAQKPEIDARIAAEMDSAVLAPFIENAVLGGTVSLDLSLNGPLMNPSIQGKSEIHDGFLQLANFGLSSSSVEGLIEFSDSRVSVSTFQGELNGGPFRLKGQLEHQQLNLGAANFELSATDVQLNYPQGLSGRVNASLFLNKENTGWLFSGDIKVLEAYYGSDFYLGSQFMSSIRTRQPRMKAAAPPLLQKYKLDVGVSFVEPFVIDNNLANLELTGNMRVLGSLANPAISGRISNPYTGEVTFGDNRYQVENLGIDFLGAEPIDPHLNVVAHTSLAHEYDELYITLTISGPLSKLNYSLNSSPPRSQEELASLLITGYGLNQVKSQTTNIIGNQLLHYFANPVASPVTQRIKRLLKAEEVYIEPINIATEEDPGARFTFKKPISKQADVIYSIDVSNSQRQTWMLDYEISRNFTIRSFRKDDGSYGSSIQHRFSLDPKGQDYRRAIRPSKSQFVIKKVDVKGDLLFPYEEIKKKMNKLREAANFNYESLRKTSEDLITFYKKKGHLGIVITPRVRYLNNNDVYITLQISPHLPISIVYKGDPISGKVKKKIFSSWNGRLPQDLALQEAKNLILISLHNNGYYEAEVEGEIEETEKRIIYNLTVKEGARFHIQKLTFAGNEFIESGKIEKAIKSSSSPRSKGLWVLIYDFNQAEKAIKNLYIDNGFLEPLVHPPKISVDSTHHFMDIELSLEEGLQSQVHSVQVSGSTIITTKEIKDSLQLIEGKVYRPSLLSDDINQVIHLYKSRGYQNVDVDAEITPDSEKKTIHIQYNINEETKHIISEIEVRGNRRSPDSFILREIEFKAGDALNLAILSKSQKNLYDTGAFNTVSIYSHPLGQERGDTKVFIEVEEQPLLGISYGVRYDNEEKIEGIGELNIFNILGRGRHGLFYYRQNNREKDFRFSMKEPYLLGKKFNTLYSFYYTKETKFSFVTDEIGFSIQQEINLPFNFSLSYLYSYNRIHTYELEPIGPFVFDILLHLSEVSSFLVRDTRDNKLDSQQGSFFSLSFTYSPESLGSDLTFISFFGQCSLYKTFLPGITWASNYRIGVANAFEQVLIPSKRFYAGGGNSIRGFKRDRVGPINPFFLTPEGGEALFVMNQEIRFPIYKWLKGIAFYDAGNIYWEFRDIDLLDLRHSVGFGLRLNTPVSLIRLDYGINLFRRDQEPRGVFFFSIGQSF